jgi:predicted DNA-binding transcriptional regulator AlpA
MASLEKKSNPTVTKRFGSETDVESLTGISRRTLQKDRFFGKKRFPHYKVLGKVLYDLSEVEAIIRDHGVSAS